MRWPIVILITLALSFAWLALSAALVLCSLISRSSLSYDAVSVSATLIEGRLRDAERSVDGAIGQVRRGRRTKRVGR